MNEGICYLQFGDCAQPIYPMNSNCQAACELVPIAKSIEGCSEGYPCIEEIVSWASKPILPQISASSGLIRRTDRLIVTLWYDMRGIFLLKLLAYYIEFILTRWSIIIRISDLIALYVGRKS